MKGKREDADLKTEEKLIKGLVLLSERNKSKLEKIISYVHDHDKELYKLSYVGGVKARVHTLKLLLLIEGNRGSTPSSRFYKSLYELEFSIGLMDSSMLEPFFTILLEAMMIDTIPQRANAMVKRVLQQCLVAPVNYVVAGLLILSKVLQKHPSIAASLASPEFSALVSGDNDDEENFKDIPDSDNENPAKEAAEPEAHGTASAPAAHSDYDWRKRDPQYANADKSCLWEIVGLSQHHHPLIAQWSKEILEKGAKAAIVYEGKNPILDFKVVNMLDRMTYKEPKKKLGKSALRSANVEMPVTTYWKEMQYRAENVKAQGSVKPHEEFFAKYFENRDKAGIVKKETKTEETAEMDEAADNIIEAEMKKIAGGEAESEDDVDIGQDNEEDEDEEVNSQEPFSDLEDEGAKWEKARTQKGDRTKKGKKRTKSGGGKKESGAKPGFKAKRKKISHNS